MLSRDERAFLCRLTDIDNQEVQQAVNLYLLQRIGDVEYTTDDGRVGATFIHCKSEPAEPARPTDRELLDWLERKRYDLSFRGDDDQWCVWVDADLEWITEFQPTARDAIRAAMKKEKP